jgi:2-amino-4-hydroxy-6-hydroxymethyldihydropteridine diphosphokinase
MNKSFLLTGSNVGDRGAQLDKARLMVNEHCGKVIRASAIYETAAWGNTDQPSFLNQALEIETSLNARQLIRKILRVEKLMGRIRKEKYGPRIIDIDILLYNDEIHQYQFLKLPHPELPNRRFALVPLAEIAPGQVHPVLKKSISQLLADCNDELPVKKYE